MNTSKLEEAIIRLLLKYPYYGNLVLCMNKRFDPTVPLAAVSVTDKINLYINPDTFNQLSLTERVGVLVHECKHITHDHINRFKKLSSKMNKALNIAADRAINELIAEGQHNGEKIYEFPDQYNLDTNKMSDETLKHFTKERVEGAKYEFKTITVKNFKEMFKGKEIPNGMTMEYYYRFCKENAQQSQDGSSDFDGDHDDGPDNDHDKWEESEQNDEVREQITKQAIKKAAERTAPGNIPGEIQEMIKRWGQSVVDWKKEMRRFKQLCAKVKLENTRKKRNRRYGVMYPGFKKKPELHLVCAIDTSGSVSTPMLQQFFAEMCRMHRMGVEITIIECDTQIGAEYKFDPKQPFKVTGRGGTSFHPVFTRVNKMKRKVDGLIYFTDGECYEEVEYRIPTLWALTPSYSVPKGGEKRHVKIKMDEQH